MVLGWEHQPIIDIRVPIYVGEFALEVNAADVENYGILQSFTNIIPNIDNNNSDYVTRMNELKDSIIQLNNSFANQQHKQELFTVFVLIFNQIVSIAQSQYRNINQDVYSKLGYFGFEYRKLLERNKNISEEQLQRMCKEFQHIVNNKYDAEFEARYDKDCHKIQNMLSRQQPKYVSIKKQYRKAMARYNA